MLSTDGEETVVDKGKASSSDAFTRQERLQHDLFVLKKLNASFTLYNDALKNTRSSTENVALQLDRTDRLLDHYIDLLQHTEKNSKLIFDETWKGGAIDQELLENLRLEALQRAEREREEHERATRLEQERQEKEAQERKLKEEERDEGERLKRVSNKGVRGVRGVRARAGMSAATRGRIATSSSTSSKREASEVSSRGNITSRGGRKS